MSEEIKKDRRPGFVRKLQERMAPVDGKIRSVSTRCSEGFLGFVQKYWFWIAVIALAVLGLVVRILMYSFRSGDYNFCLIPWYRRFYEDGIRATLGDSFGDYTPPYLYFMAFISLFRLEPEGDAYLYFLKSISVLFDYGSAILVLFMALRLTKKNRLLALLAYCGALFFPTILFNGALWGQCDSIYSFFVVLALFLFFFKHPAWAFFCVGISFSFKLQSVFFFPLVAFLVLRKKAKFRHLLLILLGYFVMMLPALICGRPLGNILSIYFSQGGSYPYLTLNAPSVYAFVSNSGSSQDVARNSMLPAAPFFGLALVGMALVTMYVKFEDPKDDEIVELAYFFALLAPYVMPRMHERYFYLSDILAAMMLFVRPKKFYIVLLSVMGSLSGYITYLTDSRWMDKDSTATIRLGAVFMGAAVLLTLVDLLQRAKAGKALLKDSAETPMETASFEASRTTKEEAPLAAEDSSETVAEE